MRRFGYVGTSCIIFKKGNPRRFGYVVEASLSKQEIPADSGMQLWRHFQNRKFAPIRVCESGFIFKTRNSCRFEYVIVASFSKQEIRTDLGMQSWRHFQNKKFTPIWVCNHGVIFKTRNLHRFGYVKVASDNRREQSGGGGKASPHLGKFDFIVMAPVTVPM